MRAMMSLMTLPPGPMTFLMNSGRIWMVVMRGAYWLISLRGAAQRLEHLAQDVQPALTRLLQRAAHDLRGEAGDLDVHLDGR